MEVPCEGAVAGLGHGTEFVVRLPLLEAPKVLHAYGRQAIAPTVSASTKRILIIDDNKDATDSMAMLLRTAGHEVRTAYDGRTALVLCRLGAPRSGDLRHQHARYQRLRTCLRDFARISAFETFFSSRCQDMLRTKIDFGRKKRASTPTSPSLCNWRA